MFTGMLHAHVTMAGLLIVIILVKTALLFLDKKELLEKINQRTKIPHIVISTFLVLTGIYLAFNSGNISSGNWFMVKLLIVITAIPLSIFALKKENKYLAAIGLMAFIYVYGISETRSVSFSHDTPIESVGNENQLSDGQTIYQTHCQNCHGAAGKLGLSGAPDLTASVISDVEMKERIVNGKNAMQGYGKILSEEEIEKVIDYIHSFGK